jgi:hypothetical protein
METSPAMARVRLAKSEKRKGTQWYNASTVLMKTTMQNGRVLLLPPMRMGWTPTGTPTWVPQIISRESWRD